MASDIFTSPLPPLTPRDYQDAAYPAVCDWMEKNDGNPLIVVPTGGGKGLIIAEFIRRTREQWTNTRFLILSHVAELLEQDGKAIERQCPDLHVTYYSASLREKNNDGDVVIAGIQSIHRKAHILQSPSPDVVIVDECHLIPHDGEGMYRRFLADMKKINPHIRVIGMTATPFRKKGGLLHKGEGALFHGIAYEIGILDLLERGYLSPLITPTMSSRIDMEGVKVRGGEYVASDLQDAADKEHLVKSCVQETVSHGTGRKRWLVFTAGKKHCQHVRDELAKYGVDARIVTDDTPKAERDAIVKWHKEKSNDVRCIVNVAVFTTGFDSPATDLIALITSTRSPVLYCLDKETEILTSKGWRGIRQISSGDCAPGLDMSSGYGKWARVISSFERDMLPEERWVEYDAPRANFRVTSNHNLLISTKKFNGGKSDYRLCPAIVAAGLKNGFYMPTAVEINQPGVPLTDAEIYFIGMVLTDGHVTPHTVQISQSERHPEIIQRIEKCLNQCGFVWSKRKVTGFTQYNQRYTRWVYSIPIGKPRAKGRLTQTFNIDSGKNCSRLLPYLDKDISPLLMSISKQQFVVLLTAIFDGDGFKVDKVPGIDYTPRSFSICSAKKAFMDKMQALAAIHGFTANLRQDNAASRKKPIWYITISPQDWRSIGGVGDRPQVKVLDYTQEKVWCIETSVGTIITRRRGKVTVMGNCQIMGRGMRLADGKEDCVVLDFGGVIETLGPIDQIRLPEKRKGEKRDAPSKSCPECGENNHAAARVCIQCDYEFPAPAPSIDAQASGAAILSTQMRTELHGVNAMSLYRHKKEGKRDTLRVEYLSGFTQIFKKWLGVEHSGRARNEFIMWWTLHGGGKPPLTIDEAIARKGELKKPQAIMTRKIGRFHEVVSVEF